CDCLQHCTIASLRQAPTLAERSKQDPTRLINYLRHSVAARLRWLGMTSENITWRPVKEPIATTLMRTGAIALVVGAILAWWSHDLRQWPLASLLVFWPAFGGHWVE